MALHIFWDSSNIWGGAQHVRELCEPDVPWCALRVYFRNLHDLVTQRREVDTKVLAGSVPPECENLWDYARELGFDTDLLRRVELFDGRHKEQGVDEILHLKMGNVILDHQLPQTMAILSGDGSVSEYGTSFPGQAKRALQNGWDVEIYSWSPGLSPAFHPLSNDFSNRVTIIELDPHYQKLTFIKGGEYYRMDDDGKKIYFTVPDRVVTSL